MARSLLTLPDRRLWMRLCVFVCVILREFMRGVTIIYTYRRVLKLAKEEGGGG